MGKLPEMSIRSGHLLLIFCVLVFPFGILSAQETDVPQFIQARERSFFFSGHTQGFGFGYQQGRILNIHSTLFWEAAFATMRHPKEYKRTNESFPNTRTYSYGKLNKVYMFRGGAGVHRVLTNKPYWGGVQARYNVSAGLNLSVAEPVYLYILHYSPSENKFYRILEKYDPDSHFSDNIYGRGPFGKGLKDAKLYPGGYLKGGLNFEFGDEPGYLRALEVGCALDMFPRKIPIMAFAKNTNLFLTLYLSFHIGDRT